MTVLVSSIIGVDGTTLVTERSTRIQAGKKAVIGLHGHGGLYTMLNPAGPVWPLGEITRQLAELGYIVMNIDAGGVAAWSGPAAIAAIEADWQYLADRGVTKVALHGWSMGGLTAFNFAKRHPEYVIGFWTWAAAVKQSYHYGIYGAELDAAYPPNYAANHAGYDPSDEPATYKALGIPMQNVHSDDDPTVPWVQVSPFYTAVAPEVQNTLVTGRGHTPFYGFSLANVIAFFESLAW